jgi:hypothetical protein
VDSPTVSYAPRPDATQEAELNALAAIYAFLLNKKIAEQALNPTPTTTTEACKEGKEVAMT